METDKAMDNYVKYTYFESRKNSMAKILLVEDDSQLSKKLGEWLTLEHHLVEIVSSGEDALQLLTNFKFDLVLLDWNLTGITGLTVCLRYRASGGTSPIIFLTGEGDLDHKELGLDSGADDYVVKPFEMRELAARMRTVLRRPKELLSSELVMGDICLDSAERTLICGNKRIHLMPKEAVLLEYLMRHPSKCFPAKALLDAVWPSESDTNEDTVRTCVKTLRQKLIKIGKPELIKTVLHSGYKIDRY
jgi:DNA-binding response OmpR family regulator